ncbi:MAG: class I SAM-dependent methyltransferase [Cyanobacteriota bacterium]|jgi:SAM-dependent methyltransferase
MSSFKSLEFDTWQRGAAAYDRLFGTVTRAAIAPLLDALAISPGQRFLDICCGTGHAAAAALERGAAVWGVDLAPAMVERARRQAPGGEFQVGDAEALPFEDDRFDAAGCWFGLNHLPDQERALAEAWRVLRPGGLYGFTIWCPPGASKFHELVQEAIRAHGRVDLPAPVDAPRLRFGEPELCVEVLRAAGFEQPEVHQLPLAFALDSPHTVLELAATSPRVSRLLALQSADDRHRIEAAIGEGALAYRRGDHIHLPIPALLTLGRKPA